MALQILLVEDEPELLQEIRDYLLRQAHRVISAGSYREAERLLASSPPPDLDVVLCDVNLGGPDGFQLYEAFGSVRPNSRWILMSGDPDYERLAALRKRRRDLGPCQLIAKPVSLRLLTAQIVADPPP